MVLLPNQRRPKGAAGPAGVPGAEEWWRPLDAVLTCGVIVLGPEGQLLGANGTAQEILGLSLAELRGHPLDHAIVMACREDGADLPPLERPVQMARRTGLPQRNVVMCITRHDGRRRWLQADAMPLLDDDGMLAWIVASFMDITAHKAAAEALRESEARKGAIMEAALDAIITVTHDGRISEFNPAAEFLFGYSRAEAVGREVTALIVPPAQRTQHMGSFKQHLATGRTLAIGRRVEGRAVRRDGTEFPVEVTTTRVPGADPPTFIGYIRDITARKQAEEALEQQNEALRYQALHDALTGLPNRILFHDRMQQALLTVARDHHPLALLLLDLDRFKEVNDTFGHHCGDLLLQQVARRAGKALRASDTVARLGGDEFAVLLPGADATGAIRVARDIVAALAEPVAIGDHRLTVTPSIGISLAPEHSKDTSTLLRYADLAMYTAKRAGGGWAIYAPGQD